MIKLLKKSKSIKVEFRGREGFRIREKHIVVNFLVLGFSNVVTVFTVSLE